MNLGGILGSAGGGLQQALPMIQQQQKIQEAQKSQQAQALAAKIMQQMSAQPTAGPGQPPTMAPVPGQAPGGAAPQGGQVPPSQPAGGAGPQIQQTPGAQGFDPMAMMKQLGGSGAPGDVQFQALQHAMSVMNPYDKMQTQMQMKEMQLGNQMQMLQQKMQETELQGAANRGAREAIAKMNTGSREKIAGEQIGGRQSEGAANRASRESIAGSTNATREKTASMRGAGKAGGADPVAQAIEKELQNSRTILTTMLNNGKGPGKPEYDDEKKNYNRLNDELEQKRAATTVASHPDIPQPMDSDVAHLKEHPELKEQFDAHFGAGAAAKALGQ